MSAYENRDDVLVLALPRGGVPVASEVAKKLHVPLDVFVVRKLGLPGYPELAMGAIASGGVRSLNSEVLNSLKVPADVFEEVTARELREVERREQAYRGARPPPVVAGKTIILVDDGIATGSTMIAGIGALRQQDASCIVAAAPVIATTTYPEIKRAADEVVAVLISDEFAGVGSFYEDFSQTTDEEVRELLRLPNE
ncbi:MAG: phosphoribosyltransferase [Verrucomicrobiota bacterium]|nr:phosphoribosyltransferase [Verrucomicrobiota bacterium]